MNVLFNLENLFTEDPTGLKYFFGLLGFIYMIIIILLCIALIVYIIQVIGLSIIAKRNYISSPVLKALFIPNYLLGELAFETYSKTKYTWVKWVMLFLGFGVSLVVNGESSEGSAIFSIAGSITAIMTLVCYAKILMSDEKRKTSALILTIFGLGPITLLFRAKKLPLGIDVAGTISQPSTPKVHSETSKITNNQNINYNEEYKFCSHCGNKVSGTAKFCNSCGSEIK